MANRIQTNTNLLQEQKGIIDEYDSMERADLEKKRIHVSLAGRVILKRHQGKTTFCVLKDSTGKFSSI